MQDPALERVIRAHPLVEGLSADHLASISRTAHRRDFQPGQYLLRRGESADRLFLIWSGDVALGFSVPDRGFCQLDTLSGWDVLGWSWIVEPHRWHFDARATTEVGVVELDTRRLRDEAESDPALRLELLERLAPLIVQRLHLTQEHLLSAKCQFVSL